MKKFRVPLTRDCTFTQTANVVVEAESAEDAKAKAEDMFQDDVLERFGWDDDEDSFHYGEDSGTYVPDNDAIEEVS